MRASAIQIGDWVLRSSLGEMLNRFQFQFREVMSNRSYKSAAQITGWPLLIWIGVAGMITILGPAMILEPVINSIYFSDQSACDCQSVLRLWCTIMRRTDPIAASAFV